MSYLKSIDGYIAKAEETLVAIMIYSIIGINVFQILIRLIEVNMPSYASSVNKVLVLWLAMVGGSLATRKAEHIKVDFVSRHLKGVGRRSIMISINIFAMVTAGFLFKCSVDFIKMEYEMGEELTAIPVQLWVLQLIMPVSIFIIIYRFFLLFLDEIGGK